MMALSSFSAPPDLIMLADDIAVEQSISRSAVFRQAFLYWIQREHPAKWKEIADV